MTIITDRGNFGSWKDILQDMEFEKYNTITVKDAICICNLIHLGGIFGITTKQDIEKLVNGF